MRSINCIVVANMIQDNYTYSMTNTNNSTTCILLHVHCISKKNIQYLCTKIHGDQ